MTWPLNRIRPAFPHVVAEPSRADLTPTIDREQVVAAFDRLARYALLAGCPDIADEVLDERRKIRAPRSAVVPVIPGRTS